MKNRGIIISCGPIPAKLDSVKYLTNRFKGGLAFATAEKILRSGLPLTIVKWKYTPLPDVLRNGPVSSGILDVVDVEDVYQYCYWFEANAERYHTFIMAAAVANLAPVDIIQGKFPSHDYKPGDRFDIPFTIAPRAIDVVKKKNPRACLIGYKLFDGSEDELVLAARLTLEESKANIIFANHPATASTEKLAVTPDGVVTKCGFDEHVDLILRAHHMTYMETRVSPLDGSESADPAIRHAMAIVSMFEKTFPGFGTVAVPVDPRPGRFVTTSRGHVSGPVLVRDCDSYNMVIDASGKATLNAPTLEQMLRKFPGHIIVHRHFDDPSACYDPDELVDAGEYTFPGSLQEATEIRHAEFKPGIKGVLLPGHGYLVAKPILPVDWSRYYELFPERYTKPCPVMEDYIRRFDGKETLEIGGNVRATGKYSYDPYVESPSAINLDWDQVISMRFDLVFARNAVNYLSRKELEAILTCCDNFVANTFLEAPKHKVTDREAVTLDDSVPSMPMVMHALRLPDDGIMVHRFHAHGVETYESLGLRVIPYGKNSALVVKGCALSLS